MNETDILLILITIIVNAIPAFSPLSTWSVMILFRSSFPQQYESIPYLIFLGIIGSTIGRVILAKLMYRFSKNIENVNFHRNVDFFERVLTKKKFYPFIFSLVYSIFPTPTNWLFIPAGKNNQVLIQISIGHALGRIVNYTYTLLFFSELFKQLGSSNPLSPLNLTITLGFGIFILIDWEMLFIQKKFKWIFENEKQFT
jgi:hypothetical protein